MFITRFDPTTATDSDWVALNTFNNIVRAEEWPDDLPHPVEKTRLDLTERAPTSTLYTWLVWDNEAIVASAGCVIDHGETNQHIAWSGINVLPSYRCQGIGRQLLALV